MQPCSCSILLRRDDRFNEGGFPTCWVGDDMTVAAAAAGCFEVPTHIREAIKSFILKPSLPLLMLPHKGSSPLLFSCWVAYQLALVVPVKNISVTDLVNASFNRDGKGDLLAFAKNAHTGLMIRLGHDAPHSYLGPTLAEILHVRWSRKAPTILSCERPLEQMTALYGPGAVRALQTYPRLCRCP